MFFEEKVLQTLLTDDQKRREFIVEHKDLLYEEVELLKESAKHLNLSDWNQEFIYRFDLEARLKNWKATKFQDTLGEIWDNNQKSRTLAPREHLKTHTALSYALKRVFTREYPLEINYYHISGELAEEKFNKLRLVCERNPYLALALDVENARSWSNDKIELSDGTIILPLSYQQGVVGKHPHIIILDDIIDVSIVYSDDQNKKAINKFYANIYPQISKEDKDKKIIMLGTSQREDDIYQKLPTDFEKKTFAAVISDERMEILSPEIYTYNGLMKIKADISAELGERFWLKEYMNVPLSAMGIIVKPEWIKYYDPNELDDYAIQRRLVRVTGWDLSVGKDIEKNDWTVGIVLDVLPARNLEEKIKFYVRYIFRERLDFPKRLKAVKTVNDSYSSLAIGIEDVAFQYDTIISARNQYALPIVEVAAIKNKIQSFQVEVAPYFENSQVFILEDIEEHKKMRLELLALPVGEFDDIADALKIAIKTYLIGVAGPLTDTEKSDESMQITGNLLDKQF